MNVLINWWDEYSLEIILTVGTIFTWAWMVKYRDRLKIKWYAAGIIAILHTTWGVFCVSAFAFAESGWDLSALGNMSLFGGVFLMPVFYMILAKILRVQGAEVFDICTNCTIFTLMCSRFNCLRGGCCRGLLIGETSYRWPTRECEIIFYLVLLVLNTRRLKRGQTNGRLYPVYMISYGVFRFVVEGFREYRGASYFHIAHVWSLVAIGCGGIVYMIMKINGDKSVKKAKKKKK